MNIALTQEQADAIVTESLKATKVRLEEMYQDRRDGGRMAIFEHDPIDDLCEMKKHIRACERLINWYGGSPACLRRQK